MNSHEDGHVDRTNSQREDFGRDKVRNGEPADGPSDGVDVDGRNGCATSCHGRRASLNLLGSPAIGDFEVSTDKSQSEDLHGDTSHERSTSADEVDDKHGEDENRN